MKIEGGCNPVYYWYYAQYYNTGNVLMSVYSNNIE